MFLIRENVVIYYYTALKTSLSFVTNKQIKVFDFMIWLIQSTLVFTKYVTKVFLILRRSQRKVWSPRVLFKLESWNMWGLNMLLDFLILVRVSTLIGSQSFWQTFQYFLMQILGKKERVIVEKYQLKLFAQGQYKVL